jgi:hypothetical protein
MTYAIALNATEFSSYLAAIEAHPFASLLLAAIVIVFIRAGGRARGPRADDGRTPRASGSGRQAAVKKPPAGCPPVA